MPSAATATPTAREATLPTELYDQDCFVISAIQVEGCTRGQARALFSREWDVEFPRVRMHRTHFYDSPDYRAEMEEDGIEEPYDGWPLTECGANTPGAAEFWVFDKDESHVS